MNAVRFPGIVAGRTKVWSGEPTPVATLDRMKEMVLEEYEHPPLVEIATNIAEQVREKDNAAIAGAIMRYLRQHTRFVADPIGEQNLKAPLYMLGLIQADKIAGGDCADIAMLAAALDMAVGIPAKFIAEGYEPKNPRLVHVYTIAQVQQNRWVNQDTQRTPAEADSRPTERVELSLP